MLSLGGGVFQENAVARTLEPKLIKERWLGLELSKRSPKPYLEPQ